MPYLQQQSVVIAVPHSQYGAGDPACLANTGANVDRCVSSVAETMVSCLDAMMVSLASVRRSGEYLGLSTSTAASKSGP